MATYIIRSLLVLFIFVVVTRANFIPYHNGNVEQNYTKSDRSKRSPDVCPERLEAMIIEENGEFIHLKWEKVKQTLFNKHTPIWTAKRDEFGTYHTLQPDLMKIMGDFTTYRDVEQKSAALYSKETNYIFGQVDVSYRLINLPVGLLHQCHRAGSEYVQVLDKPAHDKICRVRPQQSDIDRFVNCGNPTSEPVPCTSGDCGTSTERRVVKRDANLEQYNVTKIRRRRDRRVEELYIETLVLVKYDFVQYMKGLAGEHYLVQTHFHHLSHFNMIDVLLAQLRTHNLNIHVNIAGIIVEDDEGAFDKVIELPLSSEHVIRETPDVKYARYLKYHDLPFLRDSVDLIYISTSSLPFIKSHTPMGKGVGVTFPGISIYKTRQVYKDTIAVPLIMMWTAMTGQSECGGVHEMAHALHVGHDELNLEDHVRHSECYGLMHPTLPMCFNCMSFSQKSVSQLQGYTQSNEDRCFLLNFPNSLYPPGPRKSLTPCQQCHCHGFRYYGEQIDECLLQIPSDSCAERLECQNLFQRDDSDPPTILPIDGTPCGHNKVCWGGDCVELGIRTD